MCLIAVIAGYKFVGVWMLVLELENRVCPGVLEKTSLESQGAFGLSQKERGYLEF